MDDLGLFPREEGMPDPFFLCDGHGSRLELPFLEYITDPVHRWNVSLGLPNGTGFWQVGDSQEQNGRGKKGVVLEKRRILKARTSLGENQKIETYEIIPMVNASYPKSFGNVEGNKNAISERGWKPMNRNILLHPEILKTRVKVPVTEETQPESPDSQISVETTGKLNDVIDTSIFHTRNRRQGQEIELKERRKKQQIEDRKGARDLAKIHGRLTAGVLVK
jgi:hypothetical protein